MSLFRIKATMQNIVESKGKLSVSQAMIKAGYPKTTAKNPQQVTRSKTWKRLMDEFLPDDYLSKKHKELLEKKEYIAIGKPGEREVLETGEIDANAVSKGLDMAYKLKGKYQKDKENEEEARKTLDELERENIELKNAIEKRKLQAQPRN